MLYFSNTDKISLITKEKYTLVLAYANNIKLTFKNYLKDIFINKQELELVLISRDYLIDIIFFFKKHINSLFNTLTDIVVIDYPGKKERFAVVYQISSYFYNARIKIRTYTTTLDPIDTITEIFLGASWYERECWDMFGVSFLGHKDIRRILTDYGFKGHPLRKDFPLTGFIEVFYNDSKKRIVYEKVSLAQKYRHFKFHNPWVKIGKNKPF